MSPGRSIISHCGRESSAAAEFIEYHLNPISRKHPSYTQDTYHFIQTLNSTPVSTQALLFTVDLDSVYTNMDMDSGLRAVRSALLQYPDPDRPPSHLLESLTTNLQEGLPL